MGKVTERDVAEFAIDISKRLHDIDVDFFKEWGEDWIFFMGKIQISLSDIYYMEWSADVLLHLAATAFYDDVKEHTGDEHCVAYLVIEGDLYAKAYNYQGYGEGGEEAKKYLNALNDAAEAHNMWFNWASGAIKLYDINDPDAGIIK